MWGRGQRNKVMKYGEGPQRVRRPWAPSVLATPLYVIIRAYAYFLILVRLVFIA